MVVLLLIPQQDVFTVKATMQFAPLMHFFQPDLSHIWDIPGDDSFFHDVITLKTHLNFLFISAVFAKNMSIYTLVYFLWGCHHFATYRAFQ